MALGQEINPAGLFHSALLIQTWNTWHFCLHTSRPFTSFPGAALFIHNRTDLRRQQAMNRFNWKDTESSEISPQIEGLRWMCCLSPTVWIFFFCLHVFTHTYRCPRRPEEVWEEHQIPWESQVVVTLQGRVLEPNSDPLKQQALLTGLSPVPKSLVLNEQEHWVQNAAHLLQQWAGPETTAVFQHTGGMDFVHYKPVPPESCQGTVPMSQNKQQDGWVWRLRV